MGEEDELEKLLDEIPYATSPLNLHHNYPTKTSNGTKMYGMYDDEPSSLFKYTSCESPVSGFSLPSDGSSSSLLSNSHDPSSPPLFKEIPYHGNYHYYPSVLSPVFNVADKFVGNFAYENSVSELNLSDRMSKFGINDGRENFAIYSNRFQSFNPFNGGAKFDNFGYPERVYPDNPSTDPNGFQFVNHFTGGAKRYNKENYGVFDYDGRVFSENLLPYLNGLQYGDNSVYGAGSITQGNYGNFDYNGRGFSSYGFPQSSVLRAPASHSRQESSAFSGPMNFPSKPYNIPHSITNDTFLDFSANQMSSALLGSQLNRMNMNEDMIGLNTYSRPRDVLNGRTRGASNFRGPQVGFGVSSTRDDSLTMRGEGLNFDKKKEFEHLREFNRKGSHPLHDIGLDNPRNSHFRPCSSLLPPPKYESLVEVRGYIHIIAKDQDGCRFLQKIFEEGDPQDMQIVFNEIIGHVVELMVDPFGNYLMQKLLEVCNEDQRMQILLMLTENPGQLIRISLNTHGTRVVQKLIETLKTRQHISLVISALEPGFLALIKDLNGNHVIKQCLQSLSHEDNKFIFVAASKYCVEVAKHQHGCCVLQCCISLLTGKHRENLVKEISANGIFLAEDEYGNFVVQYILELEIPSAKSSLISQFEGNYVHLSTQKFSSHVVEKCLTVFDNNLRWKIIQELLSAPHFKQLLQDPFANYVIGKALKVTEGSRLHNVLFEAIQCHESLLRNCPYSKKLYIAVKQYRENHTS